MEYIKSLAQHAKCSSNVMLCCLSNFYHNFKSLNLVSIRVYDPFIGLCTKNDIVLVRFTFVFQCLIICDFIFVSVQYAKDPFCSLCPYNVVKPKYYVVYNGLFIILEKVGRYFAIVSLNPGFTLMSNSPEMIYRETSNIRRT